MLTKRRRRVTRLTRISAPLHKRIRKAAQERKTTASKLTDELIRYAISDGKLL